MKVFFIEGGIVFMGILTLLFLLIIGLSVAAGISVFSGTNGDPGKAKKLLDHIKAVALFTLVFAVFSQILGLVDVFDYLANKDASIASSIIAKGIKLTFHPTLYGLIIYLISILITSGMKFRINRVDGEL